MRESKDCFYYVPVLSSLQAMLNCKDISEQVCIICTLHSCIGMHFMYRFLNCINSNLEKLVITVMVNNLRHILCLPVIRILYKYSCIMMILKHAMH